MLARKIKSLGIKMLLSGEGADEIFGGYLYFHKAPNEIEFHKELVRKVKDLHKYDLMRANKATMAWGIELRVPFLDKNFLEYVMNINPIYKVPKLQDKKIEKYILRKAFQGYIPDNILWRQKEQFSDGVGYTWIDGIKQFINEYVSDNYQNNILSHNTPTTKEMYFYRLIFEEFFVKNNKNLELYKSIINTVPFAKSIACSTEKALEWDIEFKKNADESGRSVKI
jgi:asparagine synthase (glutamine-hydrolysing)